MLDLETKSYGAVYTTKDYSMFRNILGNRIISKRNYNQLLQSSKEEQLIIPIVVNEKMEIIDGQHRFEVWKDLNMPIYYIVAHGYGMEQVKRANSTSAVWTNNDFLYAYLTESKAEYLKLKALMDKSKLPLGALLKVFASYQKKHYNILLNDYKTGSFSTECIEEVEEFIAALELFEEFPYYKSAGFILGFLKLFCYEEYAHLKMEFQYKEWQGRMKKCGSSEEYIEMLTRQIYSYKNSNNALYYDRDLGKFFSV